MFVPSFGASLALRAPCPANCAAMPRPGEGRRSAEPVWRSGRPSAYPAWKDGGTTGPRPRTSRPLSGYGVKAMSAALTPAVGSIPSQLRKDYHPAPRQGDVRPRQLHRAHRHQDVPRRPPLPVAAPHQRRFRRPAAPVFPKGTDLSRWSPADPENVANTLNNRPRKVLGYKTPAEVLNKQLQSMRPTFHRSAGDRLQVVQSGDRQRPDCSYNA